jgi:hypothetical protein
MKDEQRETILQAIARKNLDLISIGPTAAKHLARARLINSGMARYTEDGGFVWMPQYGGPEFDAAKERTPFAKRV